MNFWNILNHSIKMFFLYKPFINMWNYFVNTKKKINNLKQCTQNCFEVNHHVFDTKIGKNKFYLKFFFHHQMSLFISFYELANQKLFLFCIWRPWTSIVLVLILRNLHPLSTVFIKSLLNLCQRSVSISWQSCKIHIE